jgi:hypothetical protein
MLLLNLLDYLYKGNERLYKNIRYRVRRRVIHPFASLHCKHNLLEAVQKTGHVLSCSD